MGNDFVKGCGIGTLGGASIIAYREGRDMFKRISRINWANLKAHALNPLPVPSKAVAFTLLGAGVVGIAASVFAVYKLFSK